MRSDTHETTTSAAATGAIGRFARRACAFVAGLVLLIAALQSLDRFGDVEGVGAKLAHFRSEGARYDTLFLGSSLVHRQVSPAAFDAALAARGLATRSFNLGVLGMVPPESFFLLDQVLAARGPGLRTVFLELAPLQMRVKRVHTRRFDYWHTPRYTLDVLRAIADTDWPWRVKVSQGGKHLETLLRKLLYVGRGRALLASLGGAQPDPSPLGPDGDGWLSGEDDTTNRMELRAGQLGAVDEEVLAERVAALQGGAAGRQQGEVGMELLARALARVRAAGATPILFAPPRLEGRAALLALIRAELDVEVLVFNDPQRYPEFYAAENRFDMGHLNREGSLLFSRALAARFAELRGR